MNKKNIDILCISKYIKTSNLYTVKTPYTQILQLLILYTFLSNLSTAEPIAQIVIRLSWEVRR